MKHEHVVVRKSKIHQKGVFAKHDVPKGTRLIEYVGEKITKKESDRRADEQLEKSANHTKDGGVYIFELNKRYDIDGKVSYNDAKYINHSCKPNAESENVRGHIWIIALRDIKKGEEITYDYGYDWEHFHEHPCYCGHAECIGYIVGQAHYAKIKRKFKVKNLHEMAQHLKHHAKAKS